MIISTILNDGTPICIREVRLDDEQRLKDGIAALSKRSRYLRFFSGMRVPPQSVIEKLIDVDGHDHIAWGALLSGVEGDRAIGIVHAFRDESDPHSAEYSVGVIDEYHGRGVGRLLTAVLLLDCQREGYSEFTVHILNENEAAIRLARSLGAERQETADAVTEFEIDIDTALASLRAVDDVPGLAPIFAAFEAANGATDQGGGGAVP